MHVRRGVRLSRKNTRNCGKGDPELHAEINDPHATIGKALPYLIRARVGEPCFSATFAAHSFPLTRVDAKACRTRKVLPCVPSRNVAHGGCAHIETSRCLCVRFSTMQPANDIDYICVRQLTGYFARCVVA